MHNTDYIDSNMPLYVAHLSKLSNSKTNQIGICISLHDSRRFIIIAQHKQETKVFLSIN